MDKINGSLRKILHNIRGFEYEGMADETGVKNEGRFFEPRKMRKHIFSKSDLKNSAS